jgi:type IV pilus assembly protein PilM
MIGLDIGSYSIKAISLAVSGSRLILDNFLYLPTPSESYVDGTIVLTDIIADNIRSNWRKSFKSNKVVLSVAPQHATLKQLWVDVSSGAPLEETVKWDLEKFLPLPVEEMVINFQPLSQEENQVEVLAGASPRHQIESLIRTCKQAKLVPLAIEVPYLSLFRLFLATEKPLEKHSAFFIIDMGASQTMLLFVAEGVLTFLRTIPIAGNSFTQAIARGLNLKFEEAESLKLTKASLKLEEISEEPYSFVYRALEPVLKELVQELQRSIDFYQSRSSSSLEIKILLSGGGCQVPGFPDFLSRALGMDVVNWKPLKGFIEEEISGFSEAISSLNLAAGLALKGVERNVIGDLFSKVGISLIS